MKSGYACTNKKMNSGISPCLTGLPIDRQIFCAFLMNPKPTGVTVIVPLKHTYAYYKSLEHNIHTVDFSLSKKWFQQQQQNKGSVA